MVYPTDDEILKEFARCFTSKDNPAGSSKSNVQIVTQQYTPVLQVLVN